MSGSKSCFRQQLASRRESDSYAAVVRGALCSMGWTRSTMTLAPSSRASKLREVLGVTSTVRLMLGEEQLWSKRCLNSNTWGLNRTFDCWLDFDVRCGTARAVARVSRYLGD